jgi:hypothetical protein
VAGEKPDVLARLVAAAEAAHTPVEEGTFHSQELHQRDRQAKFGFDQPSAERRGKRQK